ncbi:MAG: hypothetical protein ABIC82_05130 [bacterium]
MSILNNQPKSVFDKIDLNKIGQGRLYTEGQWNKTMGSGPTDSGLKGQLKKIVRLGKHTTTKNLLSHGNKNIEQIYSAISDRIKNKVAGSGVYLSREDENAVEKELRKLVQAKGSNFSRADKDDGKKIVGVLRKQGKEAIFQGSNNIDKRLPANKEVYPVPNKNIVSGNGVDMLRQPINNVVVARQSFSQKDSKIARSGLPLNIPPQSSAERLRRSENASRISMPRQTLHSNVKSNDNNIVDKQENKQEEKTYGFIDATGGEVKLG